MSPSDLDRLGLRLALVDALGPALRLAGLEAPAPRADDLVAALEQLVLVVDRSRPSGERPARPAERIAELAGVGLGDQSIALELGLSVDAVRSARRRAEVPSGLPAHRPARPWRDEVLVLHASGATNAAIGDALGWSARTTRQRLHELGLPANRGPRPLAPDVDTAEP